LLEKLHKEREDKLHEFYIRAVDGKNEAFSVL